MLTDLLKITKWFFVGFIYSSTLTKLIVISALALSLLGYEKLGLAVVLIYFLYHVVDYFRFDFNNNRDGFRRGAVLLRGVKLKKQIEKSKVDTHAKIGIMPIPKNIECQHFILGGGTGVGKSTALQPLYQSARARGHKAIVFDLGGAALSKYYKAGDKILNPADSRSEPWSPFSEIEGKWDVRALTKSFIPDGEGNERTWQAHAQNYFNSVFSSLLEQGKTTNRDLFAYLNDDDKLKELLIGTPAQGMFGQGRTGILGSSQASVMTSFSSLYDYADRNAGRSSFSIKKWIKEDDDSWLFINVRDDQMDALKPLISAWLNIAINGLLSSEAIDHNSEKRIWFFMDELASYGKIQSIEALLTKSRKFGGVAVAGLQSISQLQEIYGRLNATTLLSCFTTKLVFRQNDVETAEYFAKNLGEQEIERKLEGKSGDNKSESTQITNSKLVMSSQLTNLPDLQCYIKLAGSYPVSLINIPLPPKSESVAKAFIKK